MLFPEALDMQLRKRIIDAPQFKKALSELESERTRYLNTPIESLPFNTYRLFFQTGDRRKYEDLYFDRRGRLTAFAAAVLLYGRDEDIHALEDAIWEICSEYTWVLPAHTDDLGDSYDKYKIDLFSAETGFALAEIHYLLHDFLDKKICARICDNIRTRIFDPYETRSFWWEESINNWAAVCAGSIGAAYIYLAPHEFNKVQGRIQKTLECFLSGFGNDGVCVEGIGYWNYGFGYFTYYAQLLKEFTNGSCDLFASEKCKAIALFQQNAFMRKNYTVSFSDGYRQWCYLPGLTQKLYEIYGGEFHAPLCEYAEFDEYCHRFPMYLRNFFWTAADTVPHINSREGEIFYPDAQWYILNRSALSLAAKGGHNDEAHNHNDIGSFSLVCDDGDILCDFGCGEYTRDYFDPEKRYTLLCNSSFGHSLPIINGHGQKPGPEYRGKVIEAENGVFTLDIAEAYGADGLKALKRSVAVSDDNVFTLCDRFEFSSTGNKVTERFVTMKKPELISDGSVKIENYRLVSGSGVTPCISSSGFLDHFANEVTMYMIDFELTDPAGFSIRIS